MERIPDNPDPDHPDVDQLISRMAAQLQPRCAGNWLVVGIHTGGVWVAQRLRQQLGLADPVAELDISFYRDDYRKRGIHKGVKPSRLPASLDGRNLILVDDVLHTGRTIRAALDELFAYGRPARVLLAVLVDRGGRELPIAADAIGMVMEPGPGKAVRLSGPEPLQIRVQDR